MILILSNKYDVSVDFIIKELQDRDYPYLRLNTEDLAELEVTTKLPDFDVIVEKQGKKVNLTEEVGSVWYRRPGEPFEFVDEENKPDLGTIEYVKEQWSAWLQSLETLPDATWVNFPETNRRMESKIRQLRLADDIGFNTPNTVVTNSSEKVEELFEGRETVISKALSSPLISEKDQDKFVFSTQLDEPPSENDDSVSVCPTIFQEALLPKIDYRVTVIGDTVLPVKIEGEKGDMPVDWRTEKEDVQFIQTDLPRSVEQLCREYVSEAGLLFGAIDLVERDGEFVFLEINPNGEWGWLQKPWDVPVAENLTELLIEHDTR
ncbi:MvdC/MvdD family ATP grasp protein [Haloarcula marismortui]|uniref:MvdD-like pre-ATP grasp domain-containing protein n=1 Tax=Haloarcula marismortui ATCC 33800 TaxID=662476 RepID=M0K1K5_9EURY|nr:hypothetical protein [Haloarcula sinaiiensis]EMA14668.1 hypothetical protein C436_05536 [Haloarcula sinaiiensis ATCC 33800]QUJ71923.1 hypothetical protein KDQ40_14710 [Haloarcula sinaiiensis ATCC 33800]